MSVDEAVLDLISNEFEDNDIDPRNEDGNTFIHNVEWSDLAKVYNDMCGVTLDVDGKINPSTCLDRYNPFIEPISLVNLIAPISVFRLRTSLNRTGDLRDTILTVNKRDTIPLLSGMLSTLNIFSNKNYIIVSSKNTDYSCINFISINTNVKITALCKLIGPPNGIGQLLTSVFHLCKMTLDEELYDINDVEQYTQNMNNISFELSEAGRISISQASNRLKKVSKTWKTLREALIGINSMINSGEITDINYIYKLLKLNRDLLCKPESVISPPIVPAPEEI